MATKSRGQRISPTLSPRPLRDPVERAMRSTGPRCQCRHADVRCRRRAVYRVSVLCAEVTCECAVSVYLACAACCDTWVEHRRTCGRCPRLRVMPL